MRTPNLPPPQVAEVLKIADEYWEASTAARYRVRGKLADALAALPLALKEEAGTDSFHLTARAGKDATGAASVPATVLEALDRMCTPLHESRLKGATADADARCMKLLREFILAGRPAPCAGCNGRGYVGGFVGGAAPGYETVECDFCKGTGFDAAQQVASLPAEAWQPIETAPKDGSAILIYHPEGGVCEAFCSGEGFAWQCMDGTNTVTSTAGNQIPRMTAFISAPTHWQPLPAPPIEASQDTKDRIIPESSSAAAPAQGERD